MDRHEKIMKRLNEHYAELVSRGYEVAFLALQGSQNYELDIYNEEYASDIDSKAVVLPTLEQIVNGTDHVSTTVILENNEHIDVKDIRVMRDMLLKQNISYLEILLTKYVVVNPKYEVLVRDLFENADLIATFNHIAFYKAIKGMAFEKLKALEHPYPATMPKIEKFGYDPKQLHHIVRLRILISSLLLGYSLRECLVPDEDERDYLLDLKLGALELDEARELADQSIELISTLCDYAARQDLPINYDAKRYLENMVSELIRYSIKYELLES